MPTSRPLTILEPDRRRRVPKSFAWVDHRLRATEYLGRMNPEEIGLYLFLVLAADRNGLSCWRLDRVERTMPCFDIRHLRRALEELVELGLVAYRPWSPRASDGIYQVLSLRDPKPRSSRRGEPVHVRELLERRIHD